MCTLIRAQNIASYTTAVTPHCLDQEFSQKELQDKQSRAPRIYVQGLFVLHAKWLQEIGQNSDGFTTKKTLFKIELWGKFERVAGRDWALDGAPFKYSYLLLRMTDIHDDWVKKNTVFIMKHFGTA